MHATVVTRPERFDRVDRVKDHLRAAERRVNELEVDVSSRKQQEVMGGVGGRRQACVQRDPEDGEQGQGRTGHGEHPARAGARLEHQDLSRARSMA